MDYVFKALADPTRRELLDRLKERDGQTLSELCEGLEQSRQSVSKHLNILEEVNLISTLWRGREKFHYLNPVPIREISRRWVSKYTKHRADALLELKASVEEKPMTNQNGSEKPEFNYVTYIDAPREKVWEALTTAKFTQKYWSKSRCESDWQEGSDYTFRVDDEQGQNRIALAGKILKNDHPNELVYTFTCPANEEMKHENSTVQFLLEEVSGLTKLSVRHYGFEEGSKMFIGIKNGWPRVMAGLKSLLESGKELNLKIGD